jgi:hypothetical protein
MCRSIKTLRRPAEPATREEMSAAALQFVRKVSGFRQPSQANRMAFDAAVNEIAGSVEKLLGQVTKASPKASLPEAVELPVLGTDHDTPASDRRGSRERSAGRELPKLGSVS